jgi:hypothetical protein
MVIHRKAAVCALMESAVRKRTKGIELNDFNKIGRSDQSGAFHIFRLWNVLVESWASHGQV